MKKNSFIDILRKKSEKPKQVPLTERWAQETGFRIISRAEEQEKESKDEQTTNKAQTFDDILKGNPYHDKRGRFTSKNGAGSSTSSTGGGALRTSNPQIQTDHRYDVAYMTEFKYKRNFIQEEYKVTRNEAEDMGYAISAFTSEKYEYIRAVARGEADQIDSDWKREEAIKNLENLETFIDKSPQWEGGKVYRGMHFDPDKIGVFKEGDIIDMGGPASWSSELRIAEDFGKVKDDFMTTVIVETDNPGKATSVRHLSNYYYEDEVLASKDNQYKIKTMTYDEETKTYRMTVEATSGHGENEKNKFTKKFDIAKSDDDKRLVFGWANIAIDKDGNQLEDLHKDIIDTEDLEESAYEYVLNFRDTGEEHQSGLRKKGKLVESVVFTKEKQKAMGIPDGVVPEGWWVGFYVSDDEAWQKVKDGTYRMFSVEGKGKRIPIEKADRINGCGVLVVQDGKILTGTRIDGKHRNQICGPGGHIERGEEPEAAAIRETREEFGITCKDLKPLGILDGGRAYGKSAVFLCTDYDGEPQTDEEEMTDVQWRTIEELQEEKLFYPFQQSLELIEDEQAPKRAVAKSFYEVLGIEEDTDESGTVAKFNPFHDAAGKFSNKNGFKTYSANPKTKAGAMAINRSMQGGHGRTMNVHRESKGESITQNARWLATGQKPKVPAAVSRARYQQRKLKQQQAAQQQQQAPKAPANQNKPQKTPKQPPQAPPKPTVDRLGFASHDNAPYHQLGNRKQYYNQQKLTPKQKKGMDNYMENHTEIGSLYSHSQNMNYKMANGQPLTGKYKQTHDALMSSMHNLGVNSKLTRYDHAPFANSLLKAAGVKGDMDTLSLSQMKKALVGKGIQENKFLSTSTNDFQTAPQSSKDTFTTRQVKITYLTKAGTQAVMPGIGPGGDLGEVVLAPTNGKSNKGGIIRDVKIIGDKARRKGTQTRDKRQIEIVIEI